MNRHTPDLASLVIGLLFAVIGLVLLFGDIAALSFEWLIPVIAIALGALLIWTGRSRRATDG
jgi:hypothetical protein